jgi:hypothetical protein
MCSKYRHIYFSVFSSNCGVIGCFVLICVVLISCGRNYTQYRKYIDMKVVYRKEEYCYRGRPYSCYCSDVMEFKELTGVGDVTQN